MICPCLVVIYMDPLHFFTACLLQSKKYHKHVPTYYLSYTLAHLSQRLSVSLKDWTPVGVRAPVRASVHLSTLSNINIIETSRQIVIKFHLDQYWGRGLAALGFGPDLIRTLVSMATDSSHRVIYNGENLVTTLASSFLIGSSLFLQVTSTAIKSRMGSKFRKIGPQT